MSDLPAKARAIIERLGLAPHPEGGHFAETWRDASKSSRGTGTAIYYLLTAGERSHWHRVDATEIWHYYAGDPLRLSISEDGVSNITHLLGPDLSAGHDPQIIVPEQAWQSAVSSGDWTLVGCTVSPAFEFAGFEMAAPEWQPG
ncbi:MAG: cupin domain-containing protein [Alphaproteobacteria bacterium]|jgi:uncharacterized protein|nr:cupin domain-containing protein [Alphaproteobacteria bacterium]MBT4083427.1 cupin domain-containing protein [Alphaproteobacteria bacterium]MBT4542921.1 cupin domain-containing protein [Alphaproteobacteria bacterium]MBT5920293.1 cupin domain-containing protein [Alphaproteobacteria bacterium]MBT6384650.1 cupin domain-containing protein [Alphaproteobacteria bacterium]